ncbi:PrpF domain-containing protein [Paraherbaspirillum soli]|uniref:PrpF domain-containing protein n=1 Tax=Paraherbaspirillum soli TaxID=631222 RepID=A0ABW0M5I0_9BURK
MSKQFPNPDLSYLRIRHAFGIPEFPVMHMRGGTSTGIVIWQQHLPADEALRDELIRHLMGVPLDGERGGNRQTHGLGRATPTSNKVFIVDVDPDRRLISSTLAQLAADKSAIDWSVNCGNMSAALPLYALDTGLIEVDRARQDAQLNARFQLDIFNTNTGSRMSAQMALDAGSGNLLADTAIPGVDGRFPGVDLYLHEPVGAKTGALLPTGQVLDVIDGIEVSCVDVAVPMVIAAAAAFGKTGYETPAELDADGDFKQRLRQLWVAAGLRMGLKQRSGQAMTAAQLAASETIPKICLVAPARNGGHLSVRYFTPQAAHPSLAVSGGCCLASACLLPGSVARRAAPYAPSVTAAADTYDIAIENPAGVLETRIEAMTRNAQVHICQAAYRRSAQILLRGTFPLYRGSPALNAFLRAQSV